VAIAEPKQLVCETSVENLLELNRTNKEIFLNLFRGEPSPAILAPFEKVENQCKGSEVKFGSQVTFVFDTDGLKNSASSSVEVSGIRNCVVPFGVYKGEMEATPTVISFIYVPVDEETAFNVDRKTLAGGYDTKRDYTCVLQDIDTSENLL